MPRYPAACQIGTPRCINHVAAVWRNVCGVTLPQRPASATACRNPVFTDLTGAPCHSTKCDVTMPRRTHRRMWARSRGGIGAGVCRLFVARLPVNRRPIGTPDRRPKGTPLCDVFGRVALAPSELVGVAETARARVVG